MLIYLVEDDNSIRELVAYTLHSAGFEAEGFERPSAFWRACAERRPDLSAKCGILSLSGGGIYPDLGEIHRG